MSSLVRLFKACFADGVQEGDVLAMNMKGEEQFEVIAPPFRSRNIVGGRTFVHMEVRLVGTTTEGHMIYRPTEVVYRRADERAQNPA